ncbi:uncharacterized protein PRCAT00005747001 [Priceomyces carsonii]|uniref:uncharacterized protein n=1 Tax=Priceomyces carsonii TaxID=28549 RepID=UPI002EDB6BCA|nr:unnamed protein product [Priceomyces carsonii]
MASEQDLQTHKVSTIISLALSVYGNVRYLVGRTPYDSHGGFHVKDTPFTANIIVTLVYWGLFYFMAISFVTQIFLPSLENLRARADVVKLVGWHFTMFNLLSFIWSLLFAKKHFFFSEVVLLINFLNVLSLYFSHKTYEIKPLSSWLLVHMPVTALPLSWLFYAIFWNGAVLFHVHKFVGRVVSNVLIWDFLLVPGFFVLIYNDWGVGLTSSILVFGLALGQLFTKVFALQWIFAFVIAGLLFVFSLVSAVSGSAYARRGVTDVESAPLIEES